MTAVEDRECGHLNATDADAFWRKGERIAGEGPKDTIERLPDAVLNIADVIDRGAAIDPLLSDHEMVPCDLEGAFVVLLAHENLVGHILEVAYELVKISWTKVGLEDIEYRFESFFRSGGIHRGYIVFSFKR